MGYELADDEEDGQAAETYFAWHIRPRSFETVFDPFMTFHQVMYQFDQHFATMRRRMFQDLLDQDMFNWERVEPQRNRRRQGLQDPFEDIFGSFASLWSRFP
jgi:hypothetical protein